MDDGKRYKEDEEKTLNKEQEELQKQYKEMLKEIINRDSDKLNNNFVDRDKDKIDELKELEEEKIEVEEKVEEKVEENLDRNIKGIKELAKKNTDLILEKIENEVGEDRETEKLNEIKKQIEKLEKESGNNDEILILSKNKINEIKDDVLFNIEQENNEDEKDEDEYIDNTENKTNIMEDELYEKKDVDKKKKKRKNRKTPKALKIIGNIIYYIAFLFVLIVLLVVVVQRFSKNELSVGGYRMFNILTGSMEPDYKVGDVLISKEVKPEDIKLGDDIVYLGEVKPFVDLIVTHRVVDINKEEDGSYSFITRGIANNINDPVISDSQVYGRIIYKVKVFSFLSKAINNMYVFFFIIFIPVVLLVSIKIIQVKHERIEDKNEEE